MGAWEPHLPTRLKERVIMYMSVMVAAFMFRPFVLKEIHALSKSHEFQHHFSTRIKQNMQKSLVYYYYIIISVLKSIISTLKS